MLLFATFAFTRATAQNSPEFLRGVKEGKKNGVDALMSYGFWYVQYTGSLVTQPGTGPQLTGVSFDVETGLITLTYTSGDKFKVHYSSVQIFQWYYPDARDHFSIYSNQYMDNLANASLNAPTQDEKDFYSGIVSGYQMAVMMYY